VHPEARTEILRRLLASRERGPEVDARPASVPAERYLEPAVLDQERLALFRRQPLLVAHVSELPGPGDFLTEDVAGVPLLVLRDAGGQLRVFQNLCRHQGVRLVDEKQGCGRKSFKCLYHAWRYGLDGSLLDIAGREIPEAHLYPGLELRAVAHEVRHGFVWVWLDGKPAASPAATTEAMPEATIDAPGGVAGFLGPVLDDDFTRFALASHAVHRKNAHVRACNWKLVLDALGAGHSLEPDDRTHVQQEAAVLDDCAPHVRHVSARPGSLEVAPDAWDLRRDATVSYRVFPGTVLVLHPQHPQWISQISLFPEAVDRVRVVHRMLLASRPAGDAERLDQSFQRVDGDALAGDVLARAERLQGALGPGAQPGTETEPRPEPWPAEHGTRLFHQAWERVMSAHVK
jgi:nitrite reductase/ring-hydroxylating ferredoxin subunit